ncbi:MAG: hypothetical protein GXY83_31165 [Rhodopirellula sp.]|nr:hypothetical protein [Rhodopirellula sp.]
MNATQSPRTTRLVLALVAVSNFGWTVEALAGQLHRCSGAGLVMTFDTRWFPGPGYRPIPIEVRPVTPQNTDRTLTVEFLSRDAGSDNRYCVRAAQDIDLPAGSGPVRAVLRVPQSLGAEYRIRTSEDGLLLRTLCVPDTIDPDANPGPRRSFPKFLAVASTSVDAGNLVAVLADGFGIAIPQAGAPLPVDAEFTMHTVTAAELPLNWLDYSNLDVVCLSLDELRGIAKTQAGRALLRWTEAGGNLFVFGIGSDWQRLPNLEAIVGLRQSKPESEGERQFSEWVPPDPKQFGEPLKGFVADDGYGLYDVAAETATEKKPEPPPAPDRAHFLYRDDGMGTVVAFAPADLFAGSEHDSRWLFNALGSERLVWSQRHGVSLHRDNADFWNFLIPGVGLPPLTAFRLLITLFVVVIGPVNYYLLRRWGRLHLLLVIVPASAALITLALFGYALIADGLGTRVRVRSFTQLDQRRGEAVCWSRLSYYAGLAPRGGLTFSGDVAAIPLEYAQPDPGSRGRDVFWLLGKGTGTTQHLARGWLRARTPTQFITLRARPVDYGLSIEPAADGSGSLMVENRLGTRIRELVVRSSDGGYFAAEVIPTGQAATLTKVEPSRASSRLLTIAGQHAPQFPPGTDRQSLAAAAASRNYRRFVYRAGGYGDVEPNQATSRLEKSLASATGSVLPARPPLAPGSYFAVVDRSPEVELGTPSASEEASFHAILGQW